MRGHMKPYVICHMVASLDNDPADTRNRLYKSSAKLKNYEATSVPMLTSVTSTSERPDLVPLVARWLWDAFWSESGKSSDDLLEAVRKSVTARPMPRTFILLANGEPVGTASLVAHDLDERPDLGPWLAGMFVVPHARGQGYAARLIAAVEAEACAASISTLWLYTNTAEHIYVRAGWQTAGTIQHNGKPFVLMRREICFRKQ
jgi:GNAT superfamily N-acetyltransferase